jgi:F-type H+-transporting ATPase subunit gamma
MANLKEIRNRITSIGSTMQITSAMKMVSAAKLKKAQDAITAMRPYSNKLTELIQNLSANLDSEVGGAYAKQREVNKILLVVITSNRGLCGAFNSSIYKKSLELIHNTYAGRKVDILAIGKKGNDLLSKEHQVVANKSDVFDNFITHEQFLPIVPSVDNKNTNVDYLFEPSKVEIVQGLIPKSLKTQIFKAIRDSFAAEHGARMTAMHKATDNATELRDDLLLMYNKARQAAITSEILEIVGGAEALNN